jgi:hypothetical protein
VVAFAFANQPAKAAPPPDPLLPEVLSLEYAVIAVSVLGVLAFSTEYGTGLIRTTFAAMPRRRAVLAAKAAVLAAVTLAIGALVAFVSFFATQAILSGHHLGVSLSRPGVPVKVLAAGIMLCVCALLGLALGAIIRHTAPGRHTRRISASAATGSDRCCSTWCACTTSCTACPGAPLPDG